MKGDKKKMMLKKIEFNTFDDIKKFCEVNKNEDLLKFLYVDSKGETYSICQSEIDVELSHNDSEVKFYHIKDQCFYCFKDIVANPEKKTNLTQNRLLAEILKAFITKSSYLSCVTCPILETEINIPLINIKSGYSYDNNYLTMENIYRTKKDPLSTIAVESEDIVLNVTLAKLIITQAEYKHNQFIKIQFEDSIKKFSKNKNFLLLTQSVAENNQGYTLSSVLKIFLGLTPIYLVRLLSKELPKYIPSSSTRMFIMSVIFVIYFNWLFSCIDKNSNRKNVDQEKLVNLIFCLAEQNRVFDLLNVNQKLDIAKQNIESTSNLQTQGLFNTIRQRMNVNQPNISHITSPAQVLK